MANKIEKKYKLPGGFLPALCVLVCLLGTGCARNQPDGDIISGEETLKQAEEMQEDAPREQDGSRMTSVADGLMGEDYRINILEKKLREMDFTAKQPHMDISSEENLLYLEAYLKVLKNEVTVDSWGNEFYYKDLWMAGKEFDELLAAKDQRENPYLYYYDDLDGDGKPEFAIEQGCMYIFKYELEEDKVRVIHMEEACYFEKMVGAGQIWCHDGLHAGIVRDRLIVLNEQNVWETVLLLEQTESPERDYYVVEIKGEDCADIGKDSWDELLAPFFEMVEDNGLPRKTLEEVFGVM